MYDRFVVSWLNPSDQWQVAYDGPDPDSAHGIGGAYSAQGWAVDAWIHDDAAGWHEERWSNASTGTRRIAQAAGGTSGPAWPFIIVGGALVLATIGVAVFWPRRH